MTVSVQADFSRQTGVIKPMHGINNGPFHYCNYEMFPALTEAGIPFSRLHDTGGRYGGGVFVDMGNVFRDPSADPSDPNAYDFAFTDTLIQALHSAGVEAFYRFGTSIENDHAVKAYRIFPPKDALHWAQVCDGIIRHYNEGWANGFHFGIRYWEIWNEPDNEPELADNPMWKGTMEDYFHLYEVAARYLKQQHPELKIGGYASCGFYSILNAHAEVANSSPRTDYFLEFFEAFLKWITSPQHAAPLDFFSWHSYSGIEENIQYAAYARERLDAYGLQATESILNEWNPGIYNRGKLVDAAQIGGMMCALQKSSLDMLVYYDGSINEYNGMWNPVTKEPYPAYYSFVAFNVLYRLGFEVFSASDDAAVRVVAATDQNGHDALLLVNTTGKDCTVQLELNALSEKEQRLQLRRIDGEHTLNQPAETLAYAPQTELALPKDSLLLLETIS